MRRRPASDDALVRDYLRALERALRGLPRSARSELRRDIEAHIAEERGAGEDVPAIIERLGDPAEIAAAERERLDLPAAAGPGAAQWVTVLLLLGGGVVVPVVGWFAGVAMLWASRAWTLRDKLIGTLVIPGGYATTLYLFLSASGTTSSSACITRFVHGHARTTCTGSADHSTALATGLHVLLAVVVVAAPLASAVYLLRRAAPASPRRLHGGLVLVAVLGAGLGVLALTVGAQAALLWTP